MLIISVLFFLPLIQYVYLWSAYMRNTVVTWGDISSFENFISYITQSDYSYKISARTIENSLPFFHTMFGYLSNEATPILFIAAILGFIIVGRKNRILLMFILALALSNVAILFLYGNNQDLFIMYRYLYVINITFAISLAYFFDSLFERYMSKERNKYLILAIIPLFVIGFQLKVGFEQNNRHDYSLFADFTKNAFESIRPNSIYITSGDPITGPAWYYQSIGLGRDVIIISGELVRYDWYIRSLMKRYPDAVNNTVLNKKGVGERLITIIENNIYKREIYSIPPGIIGNGADRFEFVPIGILNRVVLKGTDIKNILGTSRGWEYYRLVNIKAGFYEERMADNLVAYYKISLSNTATAYFNYGFNDDGEYLMRKSLEIVKDLR